MIYDFLYYFTRSQLPRDQKTTLKVINELLSTLKI